MSIPLELVAEILLQLRADDVLYHDRPSLSASKEALHACSLVCHPWRTFAQQQLFHDVVYSYLQHPESTREDREDARWGLYPDQRVAIPRPKKNFAMLVSFLESNPRISRYISRLSLICHPEAYSIWSDGSTLLVKPGAMFHEHKDAIPKVDFVKILRLLPMLDVLHLRNVFFCETDNTPDLSGIVKSLQQLRISFFAPLWPEHSWVLCRHQDIIAISHWIRLIDDFQVQHNCLTTSPAWPVPLAPSLSINTLTISDCSVTVGPACQIAALCKPMPRLIMKFEFQMGTYHVHAILGRLGPTLQDLSIICPENAHRVGPYLDLSACTQLQTLTLGMSLLDAGDPGTHRLSIELITDAVRAVQTISAPLRTFKLIVGAYAPGHHKAGTQAAWDSLIAPLDAALVELARRCRLDGIGIQFYTSEAGRAEVQEVVLTGFSQLAGGGLMNMKALRVEDMRGDGELCSYWNGKGGSIAE